MPSDSEPNIDRARDGGDGKWNFVPKGGLVGQDGTRQGGNRSISSS